MKTTIVLLTGGITALTSGLFATPSGDPMTMLFCGAVGGVTSLLLLLSILTRPRLKSWTAAWQILFSGGVCIFTTLTIHVVMTYAIS